MWAIRAIFIVILIIAVVAFAYYNLGTDQKVDINLIWAQYIDVPLITVVFWSFVGGMLVLATVLSHLMSGQVTAVVLTPIAVVAARQLGADPRAIAMAVAVGCSIVFLTPVSHTVNVLVMGPGGYRPGDFIRVGLPLTIVSIVTALIVLPVIFPLS